MTASSAVLPPDVPGPKAPRWWQLLRWVLDPVKFLDDCADRYGDTVAVNMSGFLPIVFFSHPGAIAEIFTADTETVSTGSSNLIVKPLVGEFSLLLLDGPAHRRSRKLLLPPFHGDRMVAYGRTIVNLARQQAAQWRSGQVIVARQAMQSLTLDVILQALFGLSQNEIAPQGDRQRYEVMRVRVAELLELSGSPLKASWLFLPALQQDLGPWSPWGQFVRARAALDEALYAEIADRRAAVDPNRTDILSLLLSARDEAGQPMEEQEIRDELVTLLVAGHETTATALSWALDLLARHPETVARIRQELAELGPEADPSAIARLPYLSAVCQETLRLYPLVVVAGPRLTLRPVTIAGRDYPAGIILFASIYMTHQRADLYPEPKVFRPERFVGRSPSPYEFFPFGGGNRVCIGQAFALFEMKLALAEIVQAWDLEPVGDPPAPRRRGVTVGPAGGAPVRVQARVQAPSPPRP